MKQRDARVHEAVAKKIQECKDGLDVPTTLKEISVGIGIWRWACKQSQPPRWDGIAPTLDANLDPYSIDAKLIFRSHPE